ncbi:hypothetical protein ACQKMV_08060 [Lysinibacillus sp. NPDC094403]|uniref:hypothetical protein n=1 Tax=Lysinibacillus sp. NPDC094403 TaxID=3390581 RepID=UPI003D05DA14
MRNKYFVFSILSTLFLLLLSGCTDQKDTEIATISINTDSKYVSTFKDLNLGIVLDFNFKVNNADKNWVDLWVESYKDGQLDSNSLTTLSYGQSPNKVEKGNIGFGIINTNDESFAFLYGPSVKATPQKIDKILSGGSISGWDYAIGDETVKLELNETYLLGVYRESKGVSMRTYDLQDENEVKKMIDDDHLVYLLKLKIHNK